MTGEIVLGVVALALGGTIGWLASKAKYASELAEARAREEEKRRAVGELSERFKALSVDALRDNNESFILLANTKFKELRTASEKELEKRQQAVDALVKPIAETLGRFEKKIEETERARLDADGALRQQIQAMTDQEKQLRAETANLVKALRQPQTRGQWGEIQLRRAVELAGMLEHCDFEEQVSRDGEEGRQRPDMIVHLPSDRTVVVDAKAVLSAYLDAVEATDEAVRREKLRDHARQVRSRVQELSQRKYWQQFQPTPDFVVMFLPGEALLTAALQEDPSLFEFGLASRVLVVGPTNLIALLRTVGYGWRQELLARSAEEIRRVGHELYDRLHVFGDHMQKVGRSLRAATQSFNQAVGSLEGRVLVSARRFKDLGAVAGEELPEIEQVDTEPREVTQPELLSGAAEDPSSDL